MDIKSLRDREFNKRVRDVVSRDQNRLRETFEKYDKQCAERMAEIHHMQEKVRFSMRSLAMDKIHINQANSGTSSDTRVKSDVKDDHHVGQQDQQTKTRDANVFRYRASVTSVFCSKPRTMTADRRTSTSPKPPRPETSGNGYCAGIKPVMSSSCPATDSGYMSRTLGKKVRPQTRLTDNMLSVNDMHMPTKSPVINLRRKSADEVRGNRQVSERKGDRHRSPNHLRTGPCSVRQRSTSVSHLPSPHSNSPSTQRKLSVAGQKVKLFRSRSNSLPDLLSPDSTLTATKQVGSSEDIANKRRQDIQINGSAFSRDKVDGSPLARGFEEMRHCRYLRCSDTDM